MLPSVYWDIECEQMSEKVTKQIAYWYKDFMIPEMILTLKKNCDKTDIICTYSI